MPPSSDQESPSAVGTIPHPDDAFGFCLGSDRRLARWPALIAYFRDLADRSNRLRYEELGPATLGQPLVLLTISAPGNLERLSELQATQQRLADPRLRDAGARFELMASGRAVCLITCSIHATEVGSTQMAPELVYRLLTGDDEETRRILDEVVVLLVPSVNPDGLELVADWYERTLDTAHEGTAPPELYHPYAGHDNNRDWFMQALVETRLLVRHVHNVWRPQIVVDLHQMQSNGPRYVVPPYIDPYDRNVHPLVQAGVNALGTSIAAELTAHGKSGVATSVMFDAYSPSRAYSHYHGGVRILAEAASVRIATPVTLAPDQLLEGRGFDPRQATQNHPNPWPGGAWRLRDIVDYHQITAWAALDHAARFRDRWLQHFALIQDASMVRARPAAFVVPPFADQRDGAATAALLALLLAGDVEIDRATTSFRADGLDRPAGSWVVAMDQPFGGFAKTLLEVQHYPDLRLYPGGPPLPPYDITAHTLPLTMGVEVAEIAAPFVAELVPVDAAPEVPAGLTAGRQGANRFLIGAASASAAKLVNRVLAEGAEVARMCEPVETEAGTFPAGSFIADGIAADQIDVLAREAGVEVTAAPRELTHELCQLWPPRVGLYRSWRPTATDEGWTRLVLEQYGFQWQSVRDQRVRQGHLRTDFDVLILPKHSQRDLLEGNSPVDYPAQYAGGLGEQGAAQLRRFLEAGGTVVALDTACDFAITYLYLPVSNVLDGVRSDAFYSPGSVLRLIVDVEHPLGWGSDRESVAMFVSSPAFEVRDGPRPNGGGARVVARYPHANQLVSGWMIGEEWIAGRAAIVEVPVGLGRAILLGFRPQFRAQTHATFPLLFNALYRATLGPYTDSG